MIRAALDASLTATAIDPAGVTFALAAVVVIEIVLRRWRRPRGPRDRGGNP